MASLIRQPYRTAARVIGATIVRHLVTFEMAVVEKRPTILMNADSAARVTRSLILPERCIGAIKCRNGGVRRSRRWDNIGTSTVLRGIIGHKTVHQRHRSFLEPQTASVRGRRVVGDDAPC